MRKLWPFVGIALAVAAGIALAPFWWWIVGAGIVTAIGYAAWLARSVLLVPLALVLVAAALWWPVWLWRRGQPRDALVALLIVVVLFAGSWLARVWNGLWARFMAVGTDESLRR